MCRLSLLLAAVLLAGGAVAQAAGPLQRRLQIDAELLRDASFSGVERGRAHRVQRLSLQVLLSSDGTPMVNNPLDPDDGRRQLERAQRVQQKVQAAQPQAAPARPDPQAMAALQARAQALMARCGQDRECLMREAGALSAASLPPGPPARMRAGGGNGDSEADEAVDAPYLLFTGSADCRLDAAIRIDERIDGSFDDVQGVVPFSSTTQADGHDRDSTLCPLVQAVLDTRSGRLWTHVLPVLRGVPGSVVRAEKGRAPRHSAGLEAPRWHEGQDWLGARLTRLSAAGSDRFERPLPGGRLELQLRWLFAPL